MSRLTDQQIRTTNTWVPPSAYHSVVPQRELRPPHTGHSAPIFRYRDKDSSDFYSRMFQSPTTFQPNSRHSTANSVDLATASAQAIFRFSGKKVGPYELFSSKRRLLRPKMIDSHLWNSLRFFTSAVCLVGMTYLGCYFALAGISRSSYICFCWEDDVSTDMCKCEVTWLSHRCRASSNMLTGGAIAPAVEQIAPPVTKICPPVKV